MKFNQAELDQSMAAMRDILPMSWWGLYQGCLKQGFDKGQSFALIQTFILSQNPHGIQLGGKEGPDPEQE